MLRRVFTAVWTVCIVTIAAVTVAWFFTRPAIYDPFGKFPSPQKILHKQAVYRPGGTVTVRGTKCYRGHAIIPYASLSWWERVAPTRTSVSKRVNDGVRDPQEQGNDHGCFTATFENQIPADLPDGVWRLEGQQRSSRGSEVASQGWYTETFRVRAK